MTSLAPVSALEIRLGLAEDSLAGLDLARAEANLSDATFLVQQEAGLDWIDPDTDAVTAPGAVVFVVIQAALRAYRNPDGLSAESLAGGAYSSSIAASQQGVYLTADEVRIVKKAALSSTPSGGVFSIRTPSAYGDPLDESYLAFWE